MLSLRSQFLTVSSYPKLKMAYDEGLFFPLNFVFYKFQNELFITQFTIAADLEL